jgi:hypothetical protein
MLVALAGFHLKQCRPLRQMADVLADMPVRGRAELFEKDRGFRREIAGL